MTPKRSRTELVTRVLARTGVVLSALILAVGGVAALNFIRVQAAEATTVASGHAQPIAGATASDAGMEPPDAPADTDRDSLASRIDPVWVSETAVATGIPAQALRGYAAADLTVDDEQPGCGIGWNTLAGIGAIETGHGTFGGASLDEGGRARPEILGPKLDGNGNAAIVDTDAGALDDDVVWDRAVGPMQFIPAAWETWGADGNGDGRADPHQIDDAALAAARYLCHSGPMSDTDGWRAAVFSYNHLDSYVDAVAAAANAYADRAGIKP